LLDLAPVSLQPALETALVPTPAAFLDAFAAAAASAVAISCASRCTLNTRAERSERGWGGEKKGRGGSFFFLEIRQPDEFRFVQVLNNFKGLIFPKFNYSIV
jgi:hypothetical protein